MPILELQQKELTNKEKAAQRELNEKLLKGLFGAQLEKSDWNKIVKNEEFFLTQGMSLNVLDQYWDTLTPAQRKQVSWNSEISFTKDFIDKHSGFDFAGLSRHPELMLDRAFVERYINELDVSYMFKNYPLNNVYLMESWRAEYLDKKYPEFAVKVLHLIDMSNDKMADQGETSLYDIEKAKEIVESMETINDANKLYDYLFEEASKNIQTASTNKIAEYAKLLNKINDIYALSSDSRAEITQDIAGISQFKTPLDEKLKDALNDAPNNLEFLHNFSKYVDWKEVTKPIIFATFVANDKEDIIDWNIMSSQKLPINFINKYFNQPGFDPVNALLVNDYSVDELDIFDWQNITKDMVVDGAFIQKYGNYLIDIINDIDWSKIKNINSIGVDYISDNIDVLTQQTLDRIAISDLTLENLIEFSSEKKFADKFDYILYSRNQGIPLIDMLEEKIIRNSVNWNALSASDLLTAEIIDLYEDRLNPILLLENKALPEDLRPAIEGLANELTAAQEEFSKMSADIDVNSDKFETVNAINKAFDEGVNILAITGDEKVNIDPTTLSPVQVEFIKEALQSPDIELEDIKIMAKFGTTNKKMEILFNELESGNVFNNTKDTLRTSFSIDRVIEEISGSKNASLPSDITEDELNKFNDLTNIEGYSTREALLILDNTDAFNALSESVNTKELSFASLSAYTQLYKISPEKALDVFKFDLSDKQIELFAKLSNIDNSLINNPNLVKNMSQEKINAISYAIDKKAYSPRFLNMQSKDINAEIGDIFSRVRIRLQESNNKAVKLALSLVSGLKEIVQDTKTDVGANEEIVEEQEENISEPNKNTEEKEPEIIESSEPVTDEKVDEIIDETADEIKSDVVEIVEEPTKQPEPDVTEDVTDVIDADVTPVETVSTGDPGIDDLNSVINSASSSALQNTEELINSNSLTLEKATEIVASTIISNDKFVDLLNDNKLNDKLNEDVKQLKMVEEYLKSNEYYKDKVDFKTLRSLIKEKEKQIKILKEAEKAVDKEIKNSLDTDITPEPEPTQQPQEPTQTTPEESIDSIKIGDAVIEIVDAEKGVIKFDNQEFFVNKREATIEGEVEPLPEALETLCESSTGMQKLINKLNISRDISAQTYLESLVQSGYLGTKISVNKDKKDNVFWINTDSKDKLSIRLAINDSKIDYDVKNLDPMFKAASNNHKNERPIGYKAAEQLLTQKKELLKSSVEFGEDPGAIEEIKADITKIEEYMEYNSLIRNLNKKLASIEKDELINAFNEIAGQSFDLTEPTDVPSEDENTSLDEEDVVDVSEDTDTIDVVIDPTDEEPEEVVVEPPTDETIEPIEDVQVEVPIDEPIDVSVEDVVVSDEVQETKAASPFIDTSFALKHEDELRDALNTKSNEELIDLARQVSKPISQEGNYEDYDQAEIDYLNSQMNDWLNEVESSIDEDNRDGAIQLFIDNGEYEFALPDAKVVEIIEEAALKAKINTKEEKQSNTKDEKSNVEDKVAAAEPVVETPETPNVNDKKISIYTKDDFFKITKQVEYVNAKGEMAKPVDFEEKLNKVARPSTAEEISKENKGSTHGIFHNLTNLEIGVSKSGMIAVSGIDLNGHEREITVGHKNNSVSINTTTKPFIKETDALRKEAEDLNKFVGLHGIEKDIYILSSLEADLLNRLCELKPELFEDKLDSIKIEHLFNEGKREIAIKNDKFDILIDADNINNIKSNTLDKNTIDSLKKSMQTTFDKIKNGLTAMSKAYETSLSKAEPVDEISEMVSNAMTDTITAIIEEVKAIATNILSDPKFLQEAEMDRESIEQGKFDGKISRKAKDIKRLFDKEMVKQLSKDSKFIIPYGKDGSSALCCATIDVSAEKDKKSNSTHKQPVVDITLAFVESPSKINAKTELFNLFKQPLEVAQKVEVEPGKITVPEFNKTQINAISKEYETGIKAADEINKENININKGLDR